MIRPDTSKLPKRLLFQHIIIGQSINQRRLEHSYLSLNKKAMCLGCSRSIHKRGMNKYTGSDALWFFPCVGSFVYTFFNQATTVLACSIHHIISVSEQIMTRKAEVGIVRTQAQAGVSWVSLCSEYIECCGLLILVWRTVGYWGEFYYWKSLRIRYYFSCQAESLAGDILIQTNNHFPRSGATLA